ncbi:MAG: PQQ-binding-like beta-propeller repeat protein [Verrucomicrobiota bacterium]
MNRLARFSPVLVGCVFHFFVWSASGENEAKTESSGNWRSFRGGGDGNADGRNLPRKWSPEEGIAWKVDLEGFGQSSPVVWGDTVYVTSTGGDNKEKLFVEAFETKSGERSWLKELPASQTAEKVSQMISQGAPTPVADADGVYAFFESGDLAAFDPKGKERWKRSLTQEFGEFQGNHGLGSSLADAGDSLVLLIDHDGPSYLIRVDKKSGETIWKKDREARVSWSSPLVYEFEEEKRIVISSNGVVEEFRLEDGERLWWIEDIEGNTVASPATDGRFLVTGSSAPGNSLIVRLGGEGDLTGGDRVRPAEGITSSFASPMIHDGKAYFVNRAGALQASRIETGEMLWEERLDDGTWASPINADGQVYFFSKNGTSTLLDATVDDFTVLEKNSLTVPEEDRIYGVAASNDRFFFRTGRMLWAVEGAD